MLALFEEVAVTESHHFGARPAVDATTDERIDLIVGSAAQVKERVERSPPSTNCCRRPPATRSCANTCMTYYQGWYAWAREVLAPPGSDGGRRAAISATVGQFASIVLDGIFMQMIVAASDFDLEAALRDARRTLRYLLAQETAQSR